MQSNAWCAPEPCGGIGIGGVFAALAGVAVLATIFKNRSGGGDVSVSKTVRHREESLASTTPVTTEPKAKDTPVKATSSPKDPKVVTTEPKENVPVVQDKTKPIAPKSTKSKNGAIVEECDGYTVIKKKPASVTIATDKKDAAGATEATFDSDPSDAFVVNGPLHHYKVESGVVTKQGTTGGYIENSAVVKSFVDPATEAGSNFAKYNGIMGQKANGEFFQITYDEWNTDKTLTAGAKWAFQSGCILLDKDASGKAADPVYTGYGNTPEIRSAMGYDKAGQLIAITTTKKVTITQLQQMMRDAGAKEAMTLDGASVSGHIVDGTVTGTLLDNRPMFHVR